MVIFCLIFDVVCMLLWLLMVVFRNCWWWVLMKLWIVCVVVFVFMGCWVWEYCGLWSWFFLEWLVLGLFLNMFVWFFIFVMICLVSVFLSWGWSKGGFILILCLVWDVCESVRKLIGRWKWCLVWFIEVCILVIVIVLCCVRSLSWSIWIIILCWWKWWIVCFYFMIKRRRMGLFYLNGLRKILLRLLILIVSCKKWISVFWFLKDFILWLRSMIVRW